jgi:hypothetical protein
VADVIAAVVDTPGKRFGTTSENPSDRKNVWEVFLEAGMTEETFRRCF